MSAPQLAWRAHRFAVDRLGWQRPFSGDRRLKRLLVLSEGDGICLAQVFPFWHHRGDLLHRYQIQVRELPLKRFLAGQTALDDADAVCFQTWFDLSDDDMRRVVARLKSAHPSAALAYLDWFAPTDLRFASVLDEHVAAYCKKQLFSDFGRYGDTTLGDTNLTDYYARRFDLPGYPPTHFAVPANFERKLWLSPHFAFAPGIVEQFLREFPRTQRDIDVHARIATKGTPWYERMRREAHEHAERLAGRFRVKYQGRVAPKDYLGELFRSKLCFSPFGYGEVCWRDFEAMFAGSLVLKPDMSHLRCYPEAFLPFETYVPLAWDLSDLEEKVSYYLAHDDEREAIARQAFERLSGYFREGRFLGHLEQLLRLLRLVG